MSSAATDVGYPDDENESSVTTKPERLKATGSSVPVYTPPPPKIQRLGNYQVITLLATGTMAEVYLAVHGQLTGYRTPVVLKRVLPSLAHDATFIRMFLDEARVASLLDHPNIVRIHEVGHTGEEYFLAMELVHGKPTSSLLSRATAKGRRIDPRLAAYIVAQTAAALHHAHRLTDAAGDLLRIVHRDVSPPNILLSYSGSVKVIDFGLARARGRMTQTAVGAVKGRAAYMAPEQVTASEVDARTDVFSLGTVLWELLCGRPLFARSGDMATMQAVLNDPVPRTPYAASAPELEQIAHRALERDPRLRFQSAAEMQLALDGYIVGQGGVSPGDVAELMKSLFAQDINAWKRMIEMVVTGRHEGLASGAVLAATATPPPVDRRRRRLLLGLGGVGAAGAAGALFAALRPRPATPKVAAAQEPAPRPGPMFERLPSPTPRTSAATPAGDAPAARSAPRPAPRRRKRTAKRTTRR